MYAAKDQDGNVVGIYRRPQPGMSLEPVSGKLLEDARRAVERRREAASSMTVKWRLYKLGALTTADILGTPSFLTETIAAAEGDQGARMALMWKADVWRRTDPAVLSILNAALLSISAPRGDAALDNLFADAKADR